MSLFRSRRGVSYGESPIGAFVATVTQRGLDGTKEGLKQAAEELRDIAIDIAAMKTGALRKSIKVFETELEDRFRYDVIMDTEPARYGPVHENWPTPSYMHPTTPGTLPRPIKVATQMVDVHELILTNITNAIRSLRGEPLL